MEAWETVYRLPWKSARSRIWCLAMPDASRQGIGPITGVAEVDAVAPEIAFLPRAKKRPKIQPVDRKPQAHLVLMLTPARDRWAVES
jgi:hypothetical protein